MEPNALFDRLALVVVRHACQGIEFDTFVSGGGSGDGLLYVIGDFFGADTRFADCFLVQIRLIRRVFVEADFLFAAWGANFFGTLCIE